MAGKGDVSIQPVDDCNFSVGRGRRCVPSMMADFNVGGRGCKDSDGEMKMRVVHSREWGECRLSLAVETRSIRGGSF